MEVKKTQAKLNRILDHAPQLKEIFLSKDSLEEKRIRVLRFLAEMLAATFDDNDAIPPMEWVLARDALRTFRNLVSVRNERLAGFSVLAYIDDLLHHPQKPGLEPPAKGFFGELDHLVRGISGHAGIYNKEQAPAFTKYQGQRAAKLRSADLSRMSRQADDFMARYKCGLDKNTIRARYRNRARILKYFGATELEWDDWKWHTKNIIRDANTLGKLVRLTKSERKAVEQARKNSIPFGITPYYLSLMDFEPSRKHDYAVRAQVIPSLDYVGGLQKWRECAEASGDFMMERDTSPIEGITRRYPKIVILKPVLTCPQICVYCQRNWEITDVYAKDAALAKDKLDKALDWIEATPEVNEVLITGGDPLILSNAKIENLLYRLSKIKHVERIRIGTRTPVTLPQRVTDSLVRDINHFHSPGKREICIITHFEHPYEITPEAMNAVQKFKRYGMDVKNQLVFTYFNSKKFEAAFLRHNLSLIGVTPYYTFNTKGKEETDEFRVPIARLMQEQDEEARLLPGTVRTGNVVFNVPRLGKNDLKSSQHHDVISFLPDGKRVYEFHPWEKKLFLVDSYVYTDVSIYDFLQRLKADGESLADYKTIWYYY